MNSNIYKEIGIKWYEHKLVIPLVFLLYCRPLEFVKSIEMNSKSNLLKMQLYLTLHSFPYILFLSIMGRFLILSCLGISPDYSLLSSSSALVFHLLWLGLAFTALFVGELLFWVTFGFVYFLILSLFLETPFSVLATLGVVLLGIFTVRLVFRNPIFSFWGIVNGILFSIVFGITGGLKEGIVGAFFSGLVSGILFPVTVSLTNKKIEGIVFSICVTLSYAFIILDRTHLFTELIVFVSIFAVTSFRLHYVLVHLIYEAFKLPANFYKYHPIAWDELIKYPFWNLDRLLVAYAEMYPESADAEIDRIHCISPAHHTSTILAKLVLFSRVAARIDNLSRLGGLVEKLPYEFPAYADEIKRIRKIIEEIHSLQLRLNNANLPIIQEPLALLLCRSLETFSLQAGKFYGVLADEYSKTALHWQSLAQKQLTEIRKRVSLEPIPQVFTAGRPIDRDLEAFIPRSALMENLIKKIAGGTACPGLVLYGRKRVGKSTILKNLDPFVPLDCLTAQLSMQNPKAFASEHRFITSISHQILELLGKEKLLKIDINNLSDFHYFLSKCNELLSLKKQNLLITIDEYEVIDLGIGTKTFTLDLLSTIRESMQFHRHIIWMFTGSHEITELRNAPWTAYLVSAQTLEVPLFSIEETHLLLTDPLKHSSHWNHDSSKRPLFLPSFWGEERISQIHDEAGGWPHLVQLIAQTIVDLVIDKGARTVTQDIYAQALNKAVNIGHNVINLLMRVESEIPGEWEYLKAFQNVSLQPAPENQIVYTSLMKRLLIVDENGSCRLRVPLMERWLRKNL